MLSSKRLIESVLISSAALDDKIPPASAVYRNSYRRSSVVTAVILEVSTGLVVLEIDTVYKKDICSML